MVYKIYKIEYSPGSGAFMSVDLNDIPPKADNIRVDLQEYLIDLCASRLNALFVVIDRSTDGYAFVYQPVINRYGIYDNVELSVSWIEPRSRIIPQTVGDLLATVLEV